MSGANLTTENSYDKYFSPRLKVDNYNIEIDGRNFHDQSINESMTQYDEIEKYQEDKVMIIQLVVC